jgi:hypothetical protein
MATTLVSVALGAVLLLNIVATIHLVRSDYLSRRQKAVHFALIWVLRLIGSIVVIAVLRSSGSDRDSSPRSLAIPGRRVVGVIHARCRSFPQPFGLIGSCRLLTIGCSDLRNPAKRTLATVRKGSIPGIDHIGQQRPQPTVSG